MRNDVVTSIRREISKRVFEKCFLAQSYFALLANAESITFERRIKKKNKTIVINILKMIRQSLSF